jgi:hypothetical protein
MSNTHPLRPLRRVLALPMLGLVVLFAAHVYNTVNAYPGHPTGGELLAPRSTFATTWITGGVATDMRDWDDGGYGGGRASEAEILTDPLMRINLAGTAWLTADGYTPRGDGAPQIFVGQIMKRHTMPIESWFKLQLVAPGRPETWDMSRFTGQINRPPLRPARERIVAPRATAHRVECLVGPLEQCEVWYVWLQYGQYLLEVNIRAPGGGVSVATVEALITGIDAHVGAALRSPRR